MNRSLLKRVLFHGIIPTTCFSSTMDNSCVFMQRNLKKDFFCSVLTETFKENNVGDDTTELHHVLFQQQPARCHSIEVRTRALKEKENYGIDENVDATKAIKAVHPWIVPYPDYLHDSGPFKIDSRTISKLSRNSEQLLKKKKRYRKQKNTALVSSSLKNNPKEDEDNNKKNCSPTTFPRTHIRICCMSDMHGHYRDLTDFIPCNADVLVFSGDSTDMGKPQEMLDFCDWLKELDKLKYNCQQGRRGYGDGKLTMGRYLDSTSEGWDPRVMGNVEEHFLSSSLSFFSSETSKGFFNFPSPTTIMPSASQFHRFEKIVIAGNHDLILDTDWYVYNYERFGHDPSLMHLSGGGTHYLTDGVKWGGDNDSYMKSLAVAVKKQLQSSCIYLDHQGVSFPFIDEIGNTVYLKIFGSPYQPFAGNWAFNRFRGYAKYPGEIPDYFPLEDTANIDYYFNLSHARTAYLHEMWSTMPLNSDILVTHGPPLGHGDVVHFKVGNSFKKFRLGCPDLLNFVETAMPRLCVSGHVHVGYGARTNSILFLKGHRGAKNNKRKQLSKEKRMASDIDSFAEYKTLFVNASSMDGLYDRGKMRKPIVVDIPISALKKA